jgi:hypothetical protein
MMQPGRVRALLAGIAFFIGAPLAAQRTPRFEIAPPTASDAGATVSTKNLFAEPDMRDLVRSGFPASLHYRLELWRIGGLFNELEGRLEWEIIVQYDPTTPSYRVIRKRGSTLEALGSFATLATAQSMLERPTRTTLTPERAGTRYYYALAMDIEALSVSDMDQLERWLRGARTGTAASAVGSGLRTLMLRMLGGEKRRYNGRSPLFTAEK